MKAISLLVIAFALSQVFVNGAEEAPYSMPWWASMYAPEQVKALVDTEALVAQAKAVAPEGTATTDPMYMGYQGAGMGSVMLETDSQLHADAMEDILLEQRLENLINMDSFLDASADAKYVPSLEIFPDHPKPAYFKKGWKFRTQRDANDTFVDKLIANADVKYNFSKMPVNGKAIKAAEEELVAHAERMKDIKTEINDFEDFYWNNGGLYIPDHISGGSSFMQTEGSEKQQSKSKTASLDQQLLEELENELDSENIEDKMEQEGIAQANAEDAEETQSFLQTQNEAENEEEMEADNEDEADAEDDSEDAEDAEEEEPQQQQQVEEPQAQSFAEAEVEYIATPDPDMVPIPPRVQEIVDAHYATTEQMYHPIPVNMVKSIGSTFVPNGGTFEARVGPEAGAVADWILTRAADVPTLEKRQYPLWLANNATKYAGELLHGYREVVNKPFEDPKSHGIVEADMKPRIVYDTVNGTLVANFEKRP